MNGARTAPELMTGQDAAWSPPDLAGFLAELRDAREEIEANRCLTDSVSRGLVDAGLARLCVPYHLGGDQADPLTFVRCLEAVARADASTAWCVWIYASAPWFLAYASAAAISAVYGDGPDALVASPLAPTGRATPVDGGVRVSGRWPFASGSRHCGWYLCRVVLEGGREQRLVLLPSYEVARLDNWWPNGLSGTGSGDVAVDDVFVPSERVVAFGQGPRRWSEPLYSFPHHGLACGSAAIALGIAQDALDTFVTLASGKKPAGSSRLLAEREAVQLQVARAEAELGAARSFLHQATGDVWDDVLQTGSSPLRRRALLRLAANHACRAATGIVGGMHHAAGSAAVPRASALARHLRDVHMVTQHKFHSDEVDEIAGRVLLGLDAEDVGLI